MFAESHHHIYLTTSIHACGLCFPPVIVDELSMSPKSPFAYSRTSLHQYILNFPAPSIFPRTPYHSQHLYAICSPIVKRYLQLIDLSSSFSESGLALPWGAGAIPLVSEFSQVQFIHELLLKWCVYRRKEGSGLPPPLSC